MHYPHDTRNPFERFLEGWLVRQERLLVDLRSAAEAAAAKEEELTELVARALGHYEEFFEQKSRAAHRNVFRLFSPPWCTPLECAFLWIAGFRPTVVFRLISNSVDDLSPPQATEIDGLKDETRMEERLLSDELARIQESVAGPLITYAARRNRRQPHGEIGRHHQQAEESVETLRSSMEALVAKADLLRAKMAARVVEILTPRQCVKFLVASILLQRGMRLWSVHHGGGCDGAGTSAA